MGNGHEDEFVAGCVYVVEVYCVNSVAVYADVSTLEQARELGSRDGGGPYYPRYMSGGRLTVFMGYIQEPSL